MSTHPGPLQANLACFAAMFMWAFAFPAGEVLLESWGVMALITARAGLAVAVLTVLWMWADGWRQILTAPWIRGIAVGGVGFGIGAVLLLAGQKMSDAVTPAIAAAMMPIAGAAVEVVFDKRRLRWHLIIAIALACIGGLLAAGVNLADSTFGLGALFCVVAIVLFAWVTRATTRDFQTLSTIGQTTITLIGSFVVVALIYGVWFIAGFGEVQIGATDSFSLTLLVTTAVASIAIAQLLWIWGAGGLGILLASLHMNVAPFYVMAIVLIFMDGQWVWGQALGAVLVGAGVLVAQLAAPKKRRRIPPPKERRRIPPPMSVFTANSGFPQPSGSP